jgi:hypothetical protein
MATDPEVRVRFPALPDFLTSIAVCSGFGLEILEYSRGDPSR